MSFVKLILLACSLTIAGCDEMRPDLSPSGTDKRPLVETGVTGPYAGQIAADFTVPASVYNYVTLSSEISGSDAVVLYFTMWCPVCDSHMRHMRANLLPKFSNVKFFIIDYVSGSVGVSRSAQISAGYAGNDFIVLVDENQKVSGLYNGTMGTVVVISNAGIIQMNEDYKDGSKLHETLETLL